MVVVTVTERIHCHVPVHGGFWKYCAFLSALFALGNMVHYSPTSCIWQPFLGVWVLHVDYGTLDFSGDGAGAGEVEGEGEGDLAFLDLHRLFREADQQDSFPHGRLVASGSSASADLSSLQMSVRRRSRASPVSCQTASFPRRL